MGALKEVADLLTEPVNRRAIVDLFEISLMSRNVSKAAGPAEAVAGEDLAAMRVLGRKGSLNSERVTQSKPTINPDDLVSQSVKTIGLDRVAISETTRGAHAELAADWWKSPDRFSMGEVQSLIHAAQRNTEEGVAVSAIGDHASSVHLSEAGTVLYKSAPKMEDYLRSLKGDLRNERWSTIIADDVSGRVPGLVVWDQAQRWAYHRGSQSPELLFMASGHPGLGSGLDKVNRIKKLSELMEENRPQLASGRALIVTDFIADGRSVGQLGKALDKHGIKFDVAAMASWNDMETLRNLQGLSHDVGLSKGTGTGGLFTFGPGSGNALRTAVGVEKYGAEALSRMNRQDVEAVKLLRQELNPFSRYMFERVFQ